MAEPDLTNAGVEFDIYVGTDEPVPHYNPDEPTMALRDVLTDVALGAVFDQAMKRMRDEGWDRVEVYRTRTNKR